MAATRTAALTDREIARMMMIAAALTSARYKVTAEQWDRIYHYCNLNAPVRATYRMESLDRHTHCHVLLGEQEVAMFCVRDEGIVFVMTEKATAEGETLYEVLAAGREVPATILTESAIFVSDANRL